MKDYYSLKEAALSSIARLVSMTIVTGLSAACVPCFIAAQHRKGARFGGSFAQSAIMGCYYVKT